MVTTALLFGLPLSCTSRAEAVSNVTCSLICIAKPVSGANCYTRMIMLWLVQFML